MDSPPPDMSDTATGPISLHGTRYARPWILPGIGILVGAVIVVLGYVYWQPLLELFEEREVPRGPAPVEPVALAGGGLVTVASDSPLRKRLQFERVQRQEVDYPLLNATGFVLARLAHGSGPANLRWDFAIPEVASTYAEWLHASADLGSLEIQLAKTRELVRIRVDFLHKEYLRKEANSAVLPLRDLIVAKTEWLQADIQGQKDVTEAEMAFKKAERMRGLLERQLLQAGVDPASLMKKASSLVLVVADVPEAKIELVKTGQQCEATFFAAPHQKYHGHVARLGPAVAREKRTLRVTFELADPDARLLPGMFAEIGLGTDARSNLTIPTEAVLHVGGGDYVFKEESPGTLRVVEVKIGEPRVLSNGDSHHSSVPVLSSGLHEGDRLVGAGAILLKPILPRAISDPLHRASVEKKN